ncbi:MAG: PhnD/SsuA/transferrin family substrate-binding protein [Myxococcota bacterium]|nr:PhnD/SsuA/transferrin family substrate-binding protein [Myxococcota bacterium]
MLQRPGSGTQLRTCTFGCVPVRDDFDTRARLNDLAEAISRALGIPVRPHRAPSPAALAHAYRAGRVQLAWVSPVLAATDEAFADATPLVRSVRQGVSRYHGVLFAARDGRVRRLDDLDGAVAAWVTESSAAGYVFPRAALARRGFEPRSTFGAERLCGSHGEVVRAVEAGQADVGATFAVYREGDPARELVRAGFSEDGTRLDRFRVLLTTDPIPADVVVAAPSALVTARGDVRGALERLHEDPVALNALSHVLGAERFARAEPGELRSLRAQLGASIELGGAAAG